MAETDLESSRLTTPAGNNALERYRSVLELEVGNAAALRGLERIVVRYVQLADQAASRQQFARARGFLSRAETALPDSAIVFEAAQAIARQEADVLEAEGQAEQEAERRAQEDAERRKREKAERIALERAKAEQALKQQLQQQQQASVAATAIEPEGQSTQLSNPSKLAIFPFATNRSCYYPRDTELRQAVERLIQNEGKLTLSYSYYGNNVEQTVKREQVWLGSYTQKQPNLDQVYQLGASMGLDGVVMAWLKCSPSEFTNDNSFPFEIWLIDVERRTVFHNKDQLIKFERGSRVVVSQYLQLRK